MERKPIFTEEEIEYLFGRTYRAKYERVKRLLAVKIHRYLTANPKIAKKENNKFILEKAIVTEARLSLDNEMSSSYEYIHDFVVERAKIDVRGSTEYTAEAVMQSIMNVFASMD